MVYNSVIYFHSKFDQNVNKIFVCLKTYVLIHLHLFCVFNSCGRLSFRDTFHYREEERSHWDTPSEFGGFCVLTVFFALTSLGKSNGVRPGALAECNSIIYLSLIHI